MIVVVQRFDHAGLHQVQNCFLPDEDLRGRNVVPLNNCLLRECSKPLMTIHIVWLQAYIPYLLELMPRLLLCLCLKRCRRLFEGGYYSRVANIYRVHVRYCPHGKLANCTWYITVG